MFSLITASSRLLLFLSLHLNCYVFMVVCLRVSFFPADPEGDTETLAANNQSRRSADVKKMKPEERRTVAKGQIRSRLVL